MNRPTAILAAIFALAFASPASVRAAEAPLTLREPPALAPLVAAGKLPPVRKRLPDDPAVAKLETPGATRGREGGTLHLLMARPKDIRMMVVYGYARLVCYNERFRLVPDILRDFKVEDNNRQFTLYLRKGMRWSDGHPFTAEDFRYYWEDIANNDQLSPGGPPRAMLAGGEPPRFQVLDPWTVRYTWSQPNPYFLPALAGALPLFIYAPAHYLKQFNIKYANPQKLAAKVAAADVRNWAALHNRMDNQYKSDNPDLPVLQPWHNTTAPPSDHFIFERNPYYYRVDSAGNQLPYINRVIINIVDDKLIPAKTGAGDSDLQGRYLSFRDYTFLKAAAKRNHYQVRLWHTARGSEVALYPNLNANDPEWRHLLRDVRFRRALSLAIDREEINQVEYYGLGTVAQNTVLPESSLFESKYQKAWTDFDLKRANELLDAIGLTKRNGQGIRLLPDGRPLYVVVETAGESTEETDVLQLIAGTWRKIGVKLLARPSQRDVFRSRVFSGDAVMSVWSGLDNGIPTADTSPEALAPTTQQQLQWPKWGNWYETEGRAGKKPDLPAADELLELNRKWSRAATEEERTDIWHRMLEINAQQLFTIGTVNGVPQPVVVNDRLRNVPKVGIYSWEPTAYFGVYKPDTFWFAPAAGN